MNGTIEKKEILLYARYGDMPLSEIKLFHFYLAFINVWDISSRNLKFTLEDYKKINKKNTRAISYYKELANSLLNRVIEVPISLDDLEAYKKIRLFKKCELYQNKNDFGRWYFDMDIHDEAIPYIFDEYFCSLE